MASPRFRLADTDLTSYCGALCSLFWRDTRAKCQPAPGSRYGRHLGLAVQRGGPACEDGQKSRGPGKAIDGDEKLYDRLGAHMTQDIEYFLEWFFLNERPSLIRPKIGPEPSLRS